MPWALVPSGSLVAQIMLTDPAGLFHPSWATPDCGADVQPGWLATERDGDWSFAAPVAPGLWQGELMKAELASLDTSIPRGMEDYWAAISFDTTKLPTATQDKLARKQALPVQLARLQGAAKP